MCILILISANMLKNKISNKYIRLGLGVANIEDKMRESCLHWFSHVQRPRLYLRSVYEKYHKQLQLVGTYDKQKGMN